MNDTKQRRMLRDEHRQRERQAAVYILGVDGSDVALLGTTRDLAGLRNRIAFARATGSAGALDLRLRAAVARHGVDAVRLEVLDTITIEASRTDAEAAADLAALETLWREQLRADPGAATTRDTGER
jgi:hypothetical protein